VTSLIYANAATECLQITGAPAAGGVMYADFWGPFQGGRREILYADAFHNDAASPPCQWLHAQGGFYPWIGDLIPLAPGIRRSLYGAHFPGPFYLNASTLRFRAPAGATDGCVIMINIVMRQMRGVL
jgi:hypothetical protein